MAGNPNPLVLQVTADASQFKGTMSESAAAAKVAASDIANSFGVSSSSAEKMAVSFRQQGFAAADAASAMKNLGFSASEIATAMTQAGFASNEATAALNATSAAATTTTRSLTEARLAAQLFGREIGVTMPRALTTVMARSELLGPLFSAAFNTIAIAGFVMIAGQLAEKLGELISETFIYTQAEKDLYAVEQKVNAAILADNEAILKLKRQIAVVGLDRVKTAQMEAVFAGQDAATILKARDAKQDELRAAKEALKVAEQQVEKQQESFNLTAAAGGEGGIPIADNSKVDSARLHIEQLEAELGLLQKAYQRASLAAEEAAKKFSSDTTKEATRHLREDEAERRRVGEEEERETLRRGRAEIRELEEIAREEERISREQAREELETLTREMAEKKAAAAEEQRLDEENLRAFVHSQTESFNAYKKELDDRLRAHQITLGQEVALEKQALDEETRQLIGAIKEREALLDKADKDYKAKRQKLEDEITAVQQKADEERSALDQKVLDEREKAWRSFFDKINGEFTSHIDAMITGQERFSVAMSRIGVSILNDFVSMLARRLLKWIEQLIIENILHKSAVAQQLTDFITGESVKAGARSAFNTTAVVSDSGVAGAAAFTSVIEALPFPENVAVAPGVGIAAMLQAQSYIPIAAAAGGWEVPSDQLAYLHRKEVVLPAALSGGLKDLIARGSGGGINVHYAPTIHALDARGVDEILSAHSDTILRMVAREARRRNN